MLECAPACATCLRYRAESRILTALDAAREHTNRVDAVEAQHAQLQRLRDELKEKKLPYEMANAEYKVWRRLAQLGSEEFRAFVEGRDRREREKVAKERAEKEDQDRVETEGSEAGKNAESKEIKVRGVESLVRAELWEKYSEVGPK